MVARALSVAPKAPGPVIEASVPRTTWYRYPSLKEWSVQSEQKALVINPLLQYLGETPLVPFTTQLQWLADPVVNAACDFLSEATAGVGYWISSTDTPIGKQAKNLVTEFLENIDADTLFMYTSKNIIAFGNDFHKLDSPEDLTFVEPIPLTSIIRIKRTVNPYRRARVDWYMQRIGGSLNYIDPFEVAHFRWNPENNAAFGVGLLTKLCTPLSYSVMIQGQTQTRFRPGLMDIKVQLQDDFRLAQHRRIPRNVYHIPNGSVADKTELENDLSVIEADQDVVSRAPNLAVQELGRARGSVVDAEAVEKTIGNDITLGLQTPVLRLYTTPGFTEASAREATDMVMRKIQSQQRFLKRCAERMYFRPLLYQSGFTDKDITDAGVRLMWGAPDPPEMMMADFVELAKLGYFQPEEVRRYVAKNYRVELKNDWDAADPSLTPEETAKFNARLAEIVKERKERSAKTA